MNTPDKIKVWDLFIRIFHWGLVLAFTFAFASEDDLLDPHTWAGYIVLSLLLLRIVWGFIGSSYARFSNFIYTPQAIMEYLKDTMMFKAKRYVGHNPAGGAMIIVLLASLLFTAMSGVILLGLEGE
ncbi:MAG: cytochrome b/b6 domain-containing protein, partial [Thiohalomonadales bacterium]